MTKIARSIVGILCMCAVCAGAYSADDSGALKVYLGNPHIISVSHPTRIAIGNPDVADVTNVSVSQMTIAPKKAGKTNLIWWDSYGEQSLQVIVLDENMYEIKQRIDNMLAKLDLPEISTQAEDEEGKVVMLGRVKTQDDMDRIKTALGDLENRTVNLIKINEEEAVVEIDVMVLELAKGATDKLGFQWPGTMTITEQTSPVANKIFQVIDLMRSPAFSVTIDALVKESQARILSRPQLACQSGKEANLLVGGEVPVFTSNTSSNGTIAANVEYKEYGIKLKMKPAVKSEDRIFLGLDLEVSEIGDAELMQTAEEVTLAKAYPLSKRNASTQLFLNDGQTLAIGGLIKQKTQEDLQKVPWLGDVPVLGAFFRHKETNEGGGNSKLSDAELFILLTPRIVKEAEARPKPAKLTEVKKPQRACMVGGKTLEPTDPAARYAHILQKRITDALEYPMQAKEAGYQGVTTLALHLSYRGEILDAKVKQSSGYKLLDDAVLAATRKQAMYPPFPPAIAAEDVWFDIPISFDIN